MYKLLLSLLGNEIMKKVKIWLKENGFMGVMALAVALGAMLLGMWFIFWGSIGFFIGKNWEILINLWKNKYKDKLEDIVDEVKDKISK
jgi:hypothetical protein